MILLRVATAFSMQNILQSTFLEYFPKTLFCAIISLQHFQQENSKLKCQMEQREEEVLAIKRRMEDERSILASKIGVQAHF